MLRVLIALFFVLSSAYAAQRPNVVILFTDDQGTLDAGCYGARDLYTPNIDSLAKAGVRFTQAYAHAVCCPARAALLTGRHPQRSGVNSWTQREMRGPRGINMAAEEVTLAEVLQKAGYRTGLFGKWHLGAHPDHGPTRQGFDEFFGIREGFVDNYVHYHLHRKGFHDLYEGTKELWARGKYFPEMMVRRAVDFLERHRDRPFFLYVPFNIPHYPEQSLKQFAKRYEKLPEPRRSYATAVTTTDHYVGRILHKLHSLGLWDNTIVLFVSDNGHSAEDYQIKIDDHSSGLPRGYNFGANGGGGYTGKWIGHKGTFLEGGIRVPAILSWPAKLPKGQVRDQAVTALDWLPTLLELCRVRLPKVDLDGRSLSKVIQSPTAKSPHSVFYFQWQEKWAVREGDWKLIRMNGAKDQPEKITLHNLADEKPEVKDYAAERPKIVAHLKGLYEAWRQDVFADAATGDGNK